MAVAALAITGVGLIPAPAKAQNTQDLIETVGAMILADRLGIDPNMVLMAKLTTGSSVYDLAPALAMGAFGNADPYQIYGMQSAGMGWNQIAGYSRVPQPVYSTLVRTRQLEADYIWADEFSDRYGVGQDKLYALRRAGYNWHEIAQAMVESQETGQPVEEALYENRMFGMNVEPVYYTNTFEPVYVPPRTTVRYVSVLPAPRADWRFIAPVFEPSRVLWASNSTSWRIQRPVVTRWSPVRVVRQPIYVFADDRHDNALHLGWYKNKKNPHFVSNEFRSAPRTIWIPEDQRFRIRPTVRVVSSGDTRWTSGRAQRMAQVSEPQQRDEQTRRDAIRRREAQAHRRREIRERQEDQQRIVARRVRDAHQNREEALERERERRAERIREQKENREARQDRQKSAHSKARVERRERSEKRRHSAGSDKVRAENRRKSADTRRTHAPKRRSSEHRVRASGGADVRVKQRSEPRVRAHVRAGGELRQHRRTEARVRSEHKARGSTEKRSSGNHRRGSRKQGG
ncbi:MAG: hypothetical protein ACAH95_02550 [Fimbriimonas sp.]